MAGVVSTQWMFLLEQFMKTLKTFFLSKGKARKQFGNRMACARILCMDIRILGPCEYSDAKVMEHAR